MSTVTLPRCDFHSRKRDDAADLRLFLLLFYPPPLPHTSIQS